MPPSSEFKLQPVNLIFLRPTYFCTTGSRLLDPSAVKANLNEAFTLI
ncbi:hypothetical protein ACVWYG_003475 [Pedobacter sp. UYEF25]